MPWIVLSPNTQHGAHLGPCGGTWYELEHNELASFGSKSIFCRTMRRLLKIMRAVRQSTPKERHTRIIYATCYIWQWWYAEDTCVMGICSSRSGSITCHHETRTHRTVLKPGNHGTRAHTLSCSAQPFGCLLPLLLGYTLGPVLF